VAVHSTNDLVSRLGPMLVRDFLSSTERRSLRERLVEAEAHPAPYGTTEGELVADRGHRHAHLFDMPEAANQLVLGRLGELQPSVEEHFRDSYAACRPPQWLGYGEGNFHKPHVDWYEGEHWRRRVTAVTFLNGEGAGDEDFEGGTLVLYGLMGEDPPKHGFPVRAEAGMVVLFGAGTTHEVLPVKRGRRWAVVSWYVPVDEVSG
jgi:predicted 2-oxoglutarate/Fe(II)-dependent dioxygenase YbiX